LGLKIPWDLWKIKVLWLFQKDVGDLGLNRSLH
jgi:hypothetical protein